MKIPFYNFLNMLLSGFIFIGCCILIYKKEFLDLLDFYNSINLNNIANTVLVFSFFAIVYEIGYIIYRIGSIIFEPLFILLKIIKFNNNYKHYNDCKVKYPILDILSREYALSRTSTTLFLILSIILIINKLIGLFFIFLLITGLFCLSWRKHSIKINKLL